MTAAANHRDSRGYHERLTATVQQRLIRLHDCAAIRPGRAKFSRPRQEASVALWKLVDELYRAGVSSRELAAVLGVKAGTILMNLRSHGYLGGATPSMRRASAARGPFAHPPHAERASNSSDPPGAPPASASLPVAPTPKRSPAAGRDLTPAELDELRGALSRGRRHPSVGTTLVALHDRGVGRAHLAAALGVKPGTITGRLDHARRQILDSSG